MEALVRTKLIQSRESSHVQRCGRTDRGVHAAGNYFSLDMRAVQGTRGHPEEDTQQHENTATENLRNSEEAAVSESEDPRIRMLNGTLPKDIRVLEIKKCRKESFDARRNCLYRVYKYFFVRERHDIDKMRQAAGYLIGRHDFRNFCKMNLDQTTNFQRTFLNCEFRVIRSNNAHLYDACQTRESSGKNSVMMSAGAFGDERHASDEQQVVAGRKRSRDEVGADRAGDKETKSSDVFHASVLDGPAHRICAPTLKKYLVEDRAKESQRSATSGSLEGAVGQNSTSDWDFLERTDSDDVRGLDYYSPTVDYLPSVTVLGCGDRAGTESEAAETALIHSYRIKDSHLAPQLTSEHDVIEVTISGMSFLWHQIRCIMAVLFMVGTGQEAPEIVKTLLDISKTPRKPNYPLADEGGLVLYDCKFDAKADFCDGRDFKANQDVFAELQKQAFRNAAIMGCLGGDFREDKVERFPRLEDVETLVDACRVKVKRAKLDDDQAADTAAKAAATTVTTSSVSSMSQASLLHKRQKKKAAVPLLQRSLCPSFEEKLAQFHKREREKGVAEDGLKQDLSRVENDYDALKLRTLWKIDLETLAQRRKQQNSGKAS